MFNPDLQTSQPFPIRASSALTGTYVAGTVMSLGVHNAVGLELTFTKGTETSMEIKFEISSDGGTTYAQQSAENTSGGTVTVSLAERTFTASGTYSLFFYPLRGTHVKISAKATGTPSGTCAIRAFPAWV